MSTTRRAARRPASDRTRLQVRGLAAVGALALAVGLGAAVQQRAFDDSVLVEVRADRAGLLLEPGADVALRNVSIGEVDSVRRDGDDAVIGLRIDPTYARQLSSDASADIVSPTLLGPKYVDLTPAAGPAGGLQDGDVIAADRVQVEANAAFEDLVDVLDTVRPASLNTALGALSTTLDGRGAQLGDYLAQAAAYFEEFNSVLPTMERDLRTTGEVADIYAAIAPQLLRILDSTSRTGATITQQSQALSALLGALEETSATTRTYLARNAVPLDQALALLRPTTTTLARYAPFFPCLFASLNEERIAEEPASGGRYPGLWVHLTVLPGADGYDRQKNLPVVRADVPGCLGGPVGPNGHYRPTGFDDGSPSLDTTDAPVTLQDADSLYLELFGTRIGLPGVPR